MATPFRTPAFQLLHERIETMTGDAAGLRKMGITTVGDLLRHVPRRYIPSTELSDLSMLRPGEEASVIARVLDTKAHIQGTGAKARARLEVTLTDASRTRVKATFFGVAHLVRYWDKILVPDSRGIFFGKVGEFNGQPQFTHPQFAILDGGTITSTDSVVSNADKNRAAMKQVLSRSGLVGLYPATAKLPTWRIAAAEHLALDYLTGIPEPLPAWLVEQAGVIGWAQAFQEVHNPDTREQTEQGLRRLVFDEAFATQLTMAKRRADAAVVPAPAFTRRNDGLLADFDAALPFTLTPGQRKVGEEIFADLARTTPMQRLLQGEVGSGKTLVALRAMLAVVDGGGQAVLMAPTEVLAQQHAATLRSMLGSMAQAGTLQAAEHATRVALLTGSLSAAQRREALAEIGSGEAGLIVGTHALLGEGVSIPDLGLVVVDEQHRFGVEQRAHLSVGSDARPHVLVMTATPIPRSVAMTVFGDLEVSVLDQLPAGRAEVTTTVVDVIRRPAWLQRAWQRVVEEVEQGRQAFLVAPRISAADKTVMVGDAEATGTPATVEDLYAELTAGPWNGLRVGLLHGQLPSEEKERVMAAFAAHDLDVLISTTVIEVGVDVPNATVMLIADAERFGISQLHQLRGRIGRGQYPGICLLLTQAEPDSPSRERLDAVASTRDGFVLAEVDLAQRREGDVLGANQAGGRSSLRLLRVIEHADLIDMARGLAVEALRRDPDLTEPGLADAVTATELMAAGDFLEMS